MTLADDIPDGRHRGPSRAGSRSSPTGWPSRFLAGGWAGPQPQQGLPTAAQGGMKTGLRSPLGSALGGPFTRCSLLPGPGTLPTPGFGTLKSIRPSSQAQRGSCPALPRRHVHSPPRAGLWTCSLWGYNKCISPTGIPWGACAWENPPVKAGDAGKRLGRHPA